MSKSRHVTSRELAAKKLSGPDAPDSLLYLRDILDEVHGRSGSGVNGLAPLTIETLLKYQEATGTLLTWLEMKALMHLDTILLIASTPKGGPAKRVPIDGTPRRPRKK